MDAVAIEEQLRKKREEQQQSTSRGAGAILFSSLVYQGWRFPSFVLVDTDERYLFELEVKVKLSHVNCGSALMDCLVEYPPHALLSRAGLLQAMLDVLGSSEGTKEDFGKPRTLLLTCTLTLTVDHTFLLIPSINTLLRHTQSTSFVCRNRPFSAASSLRIGMVPSLASVMRRYVSLPSPSPTSCHPPSHCLIPHPHTHTHARPLITHPRTLTIFISPHPHRHHL